MRRQSGQEKQLYFLYDHTADVLSISTGQSVYTDSIPLDENVILHVDPATQAIVGFAIIDFLKRFASAESPTSVPLTATLERVKQKSIRRKRKSKSQ